VRRRNQPAIHPSVTEVSVIIHVLINLKHLQTEYVLLLFGITGLFDVHRRTFSKIQRKKNRKLDLFLSSDVGWEIPCYVRYKDQTPITGEFV
jgi:hypothetical protein